MSVAFVLGNGISRAGIDLELLRTKGKVYGCNALYREFSPDVLVATDRPIAEKIQQSGYSEHNLFYTRYPIPESGALELPKKAWSSSSGPAAVYLAAEDFHDLVYLIGFDLGPTADNKFNNIYADTEFYKTSQSVPTYSLNWVQQITKTIKEHPETKFFRIEGETTARIHEFDGLQNLHRQSLLEFLEQLNNG